MSQHSSVTVQGQSRSSRGKASSTVLLESEQWGVWVPSAGWERAGVVCTSNPVDAPRRSRLLCLAACTLYLRKEGMNHVL